MTARYSVYFAPGDNSELAQFGQQVLHRTAAECLSSEIDTQEGEWVDLITSPRHYGFHATLKAPFEMAEDQSESDLFQSVERFAATCTPIVMVGLRPHRLDDFAALIFDQQPDDVVELEQQCVMRFDLFRAPMTDNDLERRRPASLSERQRAYLEKWGYPHVFADFRFHMTLSGRLNKAAVDTQSQFLQWLEVTYRECVSDTPVLDRLAVFRQPDRQSPFVRWREFVFPGVG